MPVKSTPRVPGTPAESTAPPRCGIELVDVREAEAGEASAATP